MQQHKKAARLAAVLLAAAVLGGCAGPGTSATGSGTGGTSTPQVQNAAVPGGYVQQDITPTGDGEGVYINDFFQRSDGKLVAMGFDREAFVPAALTSTDGLAWDRADNTALVDYTAAQESPPYLRAATLTADGAWWLAVDPPYTPMNDDLYVQDSAAAGQQVPTKDELDLQLRLYRFPAGGGQEEVEVPFLAQAAQDGLYLMAESMTQTADGLVCLALVNGETYETRYYVFLDEQGNQTTVIELDAGQYRLSHFAVQGNTLYFIDSGSTLHAFSAETGKEVESYSVPPIDIMMAEFRYAVDGDGSFCMVDKDGIRRTAAGGGLVQNIVQGLGYAFSSVFFSPGGMYVLPDGSYLLACYDNAEGNKLYRYWFDESYVPGAQNALKIWAMDNSYTLRAAATAFSKAYPDVPIELTQGRSSEGAQTSDDIVRALNAQLLAGDVPDILILDGLPVDSFIKGGILEDLTGLINTADYYENIMAAYQRDGKTYGYPTLFAMPVFAAPEDSADAAGVTLPQLAQMSETPGTLNFSSYNHMFEVLYGAYSPAIFPGAAAVDEAALREFLDAGSQIAANLSLTAVDDYRYGGYSTGGFITPQGLGALAEEGATRAADMLREPGDVSFLFMYKGPYALTPLPGAGFVPVCAAGIPAAAANKQAAQDFMQVLLTNTSVQSGPAQEGFPVMKGLALQAMQRTDDYYKNSDFDWGYTIRAYHSDYDWDGLFARFTTPTVGEAALRDIVYEHAQRLYTGSAGLDTAVQAVLQNTEMYFGERQ